MKICMVGKETTPIPPSKERAGAPQRWIWEVSKRLSKSHEVIIFSPSHKAARSIKNGISIFYIKRAKEKPVKKPAIIPYSQKIFNYYMKTLSSLKQIDPDIIHFHSTAPYPVLLTKMFLKNVPTVISVHQCVGFRILSLPIKSAEDQLTSYSFKQADVILPVSHYAQEYLRYRYRLPNKTKFYITYCGVNPSLFKYDGKLAESARKKYQLSNNPIILFVGRIVPEKAPHILIKAYEIVHRKIPSAKLVLIGPIQTTKRFSNYASRIIKKCSSDIKFLGSLPHEELVALYCAADVFVNPTIVSEAFGMVNIEAMACEKPVIASSVGAIPEILEDNKTGILVPPKKHIELANAILYLLENPSLSKEMGKAGREKVLKGFTWEHVAKKTLKAYDEIANLIIR